jgi:excisionase family DNA binding protein
MTRYFPNTAADDGYLLGSEAAAILHVSPKTVSRWAAEGKLPHQKTLGGHRRYLESDILALADSLVVPATDTSRPGQPRQALTGDAQPRR